MPALWKILIGLLLTLPVAAFAMGRVVGPPDTTVDPHPVATSTESPTTGAPTVTRSGSGPAMGTSEVPSSRYEGGTDPSTDTRPTDAKTPDLPSATPSARPRTSQREDPVGRPAQETTETPSPGGTETPDSTVTPTPEDTATPTPEDTPTEEPSEDTTTEAPEGGDAAPGEDAEEG